MRNTTASLIGAIYLLGVAGCRDAGGDAGSTLLFLGRFPAARLGDVSWAADPARSRLVGFDGDMQIRRVIADPRIASPVAVAPWDGRLLVTERTGEGLIVDPETGAVVREWPSPFPAALYATSGPRVVASRSPYFVQFIGEDGSFPLFWVLDTLGRPAHGAGTIRVPRNRYLTQLVNAGAVALGADAIFFAPLVRDEIVRYDATGYPGWRASRSRFARETDPRLPPEPPQPTRPVRVAYGTVNLALALGPDGRLYVLGGVDSAATQLRLDVLDTASGRIVEHRALGERDVAVVLDGGAIRILDLDTLLARTPPPGRDAFGPAFALPALDGDTVRLEEYRGRVTLVNFWASWCDPCREEFPHMAALYRELPRTDFDIAAISDDVSETQMRRFVREFRPPFPILAGAGRMKGTYHYRGLPYSVLLDRQGRVVQRIFGFGGAAEFRRLRETIADEIAAPYR